jgi:multiple antibiotic resistance protein
MFPSNFLYEALMLYAVLDPVAAVPIFLSVTTGLNRGEQLKVAALAIFISLLIFCFFIFIGHGLLNALHIPMASFQLAGSIILFLFGIQMAMGRLHGEPSTSPHSEGLIERAIFPLATPCIAGSGSIMTVMMLTDNVQRTRAEQLQTFGVLCLCLLLLFLVLSLSSWISRFLGRAGIEVVSRVFGLILTSVAVTNIIIAIKSSFHLS